MDQFEILKKTEPDFEKFIRPAKLHLKSFLDLKSHFRGIAGEHFIGKWIEIFKITGSPIIINLDHNVSESVSTIEDLTSKSEEVVNDLETIVRATAGHVSAFKMNEQSMLTFLIAGKIKFVHEAKKLYRDVCEDKFGVGIIPLFWTDEKLRDIPSTTYQTASIIFNLGFDAIHCMPQLGPDISGSLQLAAEKYGNLGVIHVINMTHDGYQYAKEEYYKPDTINKLRKQSLGDLEYNIDIGNKMKQKIKIRATGTIEPANRPYEIFEGLEEVYGNKIFILSIGIGPQGALPGCALYAGATCEGIGRFIFRGKNGLDSFQNIQKKAQISKRCGLLALKAKFNLKPYPLSDIMKELSEFNPLIKDETIYDLDKVYKARLA